MTSAGTDRHPETAEISAFAEGLLPPETARDIGDHLETCARCGAVRDSLAELRDLLGDLPAPPPMPEAAARRLDAALAAEARQRAEGTGPCAQPSAGAPGVQDPSAGAAAPRPELQDRPRRAPRRRRVPDTRMFHVKHRPPRIARPVVPAPTAVQADGPVAAGAGGAC